MNAAIWQGKCFLVWSPYDDGTTYVCQSGECADPGQTVALVVRRTRQGRPAQLHQVYTVKLHLLLSWSHSGADLRQTELTKNIPLKIYCPRCQKNEFSMKHAKKKKRETKSVSTYGPGYLLYERRFKWFPIRDATVVQEITQFPASS